jgi:peptidoglycan/LPS O-acetylase OafA/YrhL
MVVAYHFGPHIVRSADSRFICLLRLPRHGVEGVDLFFVLSGFLISRNLADARTSPRYFRTFYLRRAFRIFPLYVLTLTGYTVAMYFGAHTGRLFENPLPLWTYWTYLQNFAMAGAGTYGAVWMAASWSLAVEEQFYCTLPAIVKRISDRTLMRVAGLSIFAAIGLRALLQYAKALPGVAAHVLLPARVDSLAVGIVVMLLLRNHSHEMRQHMSLVRLAGISAGVFWFLFPALPPGISVRLAFLDSGVCSVTFGLLLLNLLVAPEGAMARMLSMEPLRLLGNMAYSTYLFHPILLCVMFRAIRGVDPQLNAPPDLLSIAAALSATLLVSFACWTWFEQPLLARGRRFRY